LANGLLSSLSFLGLAVETTPGTAAAATKFVPVKTFKATDDIKRVMDDGIRGVLAKDFGMYAGIAQANLEYEGQFYTDMPGYFLKCILGQDTVTGTGPYTHKFSLLNGMPPTLTITDYEVAGTRQYAYGVVEEVGLKWTSEGDLNYSVKMQSQQSTVLGSAPTPTYTNATPFLGWQGSLKINGANNLNMVSGDMTIKRDVKPTFGANNTQQFTRMNVGPVEVSGKLTFDIVDYTEHQLYLQNSQYPFVITFTQGTNVLTLTMSQCAIEKSEIDRSQEQVRVDLSYRALYNSTDNGPIQISLTNGLATYN
jgi:hypothetical protein